MSVDIEKLVILPKQKFLRERPIMLITDTPLAEEVKRKAPYSSQSANATFAELQRVGILRLQVHATYLFQFRPEKGDISALFHSTGFPLSEYSAWPQSKKDSILHFAYNELKVLRDEINEVQPSVIICAGRWSLYFLTGVSTFAETKKSPFGTLLKWRASHLQLGEFWNYGKDHIVIPVLPAASAWQLPEKTAIIKQDFVRVGKLAKAALEGNLSEYISRNYQFITSPTFQQVKDWLMTELVRLENSENKIPYAIDTETKYGFHDCIGIAKSETEAICIPWATVTKAHYWTEAEEVDLAMLLRSFLLHPKIEHWGQNYWFDMQYEWRDLAVEVKPADDTMMMQHTLFPGLEKSLDFLASLYTKVYRFWKDEGKIKKGTTDAERWIYNCKDCCITFEVRMALKSMLNASPDNIQAAYNTQLNETLPVLIKIMKRGVRTDAARKDSLKKEYDDLIAELEAELRHIVGDDNFKFGSTPHKQALFYDLFELPKQFDPKTDRVTLNAGALEVLRERFPIIRPIADRISELGNLQQFRSTVLGSKLDIDGRMRCSYNPCGTSTFRLSSSKNAFDSGMNLQNITKGGKTITGRPLPNARTLFIPDYGMEFFDIDLDSADLRIVAARSGAVKVDQMFAAGLKPYVEALKEYYHEPTATKHHEKYTVFKSTIHALDYCGSATGIAGRVGLIVHEVDRIAKWWFGMNPEIKQWHEDLKKQVYKRGWIENVFGYRIYFFNKSDPTLIQTAAAWEPQSTVGLLINKGAVAIDKYEPEIELLLQVHDSLAGQFPIEKQHLKTRIKELCQIELPFDKPIIIPVDIATSQISWGDCK